MQHNYLFCDSLLYKHGWGRGGGGGGGLRWFKFEQMEVYSFYRNIREIMHYAGMVSFMTINNV